MNKEKMMIVLAVFVALAAGFFAGSKYQMSKGGVREIGLGFESRGMPGKGQAPRIGFGGNGGNGGFRPVNGEIVSVDEKSMTVKLADGSSRIVLLTDSTEVVKSSEASKSDLKAGEKVAVFGQENEDGSVSAKNVQLNPQSLGVEMRTQAK